MGSFLAVLEILGPQQFETFLIEAVSQLQISLFSKLLLEQILVKGPLGVKFEASPNGVKDSRAYLAKSICLLVHLVLGKVEFHRIIKDQCDIFPKGPWVSQIVARLSALGSLTDVLKAHGCLDDLAVILNEVLNWLLEVVLLILSSEVLKNLPYQS